MGDREEKVYKAKLAEQVKCYNEMVELMKNLALMDVELTVEERNLLSLAYTNAVRARMDSWRVISSIEQKEMNKGSSEDKLGIIRTYREQMVKEEREICQDILDVLHVHLIPIHQHTRRAYRSLRSKPLEIPKINAIYFTFCKNN